MKLDKKLAHALIVSLALAVLFFTELEVALMTFGIAAILFGLTQTLEVAIVALIVPLAAKAANMAMKPKESFQVKDGPSIAKRVASIKVPQTKGEPVGVLESPEIMSSQPLMGLKAMSKEALPGDSIPAASVARVQIFTPEESAVGPTGVKEVMPLANPVLQNGPDLDGIEAALKKTGAAAASAPGDVVGVSSAGPAF